MTTCRRSSKVLLLALGLLLVSSEGEAKHKHHKHSEARSHRKELENRLRRRTQNPSAILTSGAVTPNEQIQPKPKKHPDDKDDVRAFLRPEFQNDAIADITSFTDSLVYYKTFHCEPKREGGFVTEYDPGTDHVGYFLATKDESSFADVATKTVVSDQGDKLEFTLEYQNSAKTTRSYRIQRDQGNGEDYDFITITNINPTTGEETLIYSNHMVLNIDGDLITALGIIVGGEHIAEVTEDSLSAKCPKS